MNRKVLLIAIAILTLTTASIHLILGGGMFLRPFGGRGNQFPGNSTTQGGVPGGTPQAGGDGQQFPGGTGQQFPGGPGGGPGGGRGGRGGPGGFALPIVFVLNGLGFLTLLALLTLPIPFFRTHPTLTHGLLLGYTALTFVLYFVVNGFGQIFTNPLAIAAKVAELLLMAAVILHWLAVRQNAAPTAPETPAAPAAG